MRLGSGVHLTTTSPAGSTKKQVACKYWGPANARWLRSQGKVDSFVAVFIPEADKRLKSSGADQYLFAGDLDLTKTSHYTVNSFENFKSDFYQRVLARCLAK